MRIRPDEGGGGGGGSTTSESDSAANANVEIPFVLDSDRARFAPDVFPDTLRASKSRNLDRSENFCGGEDVSDQGGENKEIHVSGRVKNVKTGNLWDIVNYAQKIELTSPIWSGEIRVDDIELSGPSGFDPETETYYWEYTMDLVSTGKDEPGGPVSDNGIISEG